MGERQTGQGDVERLESRVLFAIVHADLHRPPLVMNAAGDLDGDGLPDLVVLERDGIVHRDLAARASSSSSSGDWYVWKVHTRRNQATTDDPWGFGGDGDVVVQNPLAMAVGDFDGDGRADVAILDQSPDGRTSLVFVGTDGKGNLATDAAGNTAVARLAVPGVEKAAAMVVADVKGSGLDISVFGYVPEPIKRPNRVAQPGAVMVSVASIDGSDVAARQEVTPLKGISNYTDIAYDRLTGGPGVDFAISDDSARTLLIWSPRSNLQAVNENPFHESSVRLIGTGDLDGDGMVDLVAAVGNTIVVANVAKDGKVGSVRSTTSGVGNLPATLARAPGVGIGDVDGDGRPDVVAAMGDGSVYVVRDTTPGGSKTATVPTFQPGYRASMPIKWMAPETMSLRDLDGDGRADVLVEVGPPAMEDTDFAVLLSRQAEKLQQYFEKGDRPTQDQRAIGDMDGDGKADLATVAGTHVVSFDAAGIKEDVYVWKVRVRHGNGDGTFADSKATVDLPGIIGPERVAIGDLDGDGLPDVVVAALDTDGSQQLLVLRGDGWDGIKPATGPTAGRAGGSGPLFRVTGLAIVDVDRDGRPDVLRAESDVNLPKNENQKRVWVDSTGPRGRGAGMQLVPFSSTPLPGMSPGEIELVPAGDLDGDGFGDVMAVRMGGVGRDQLAGRPRNVVELLTTGDPKQPFAVVAPDDPVLNAADVIAVGDVDGDGRADIVATGPAGTTDVLTVFRWDVKGQRFLPPGPCKSSNTPANLAAMSILTGDLDGDGDLDLLAFDRGTGDVYAGINQSSAGTQSVSYEWKLVSRPAGSNA